MPRPGTVVLAVSACSVMLGAGGAPGADSGPAPAATEYAEIAPLAPRSLLLDSVMAGRRIVVVGERGHVLLSDDQGSSWRQARVPTRANLTGVFFIDAQLGWAVGHDEVILRTEDGGENWTLVHDAPEKQQPLLDVWFKDASHGIAAGAYGTILASADGGVTWTQQAFDPAAVAKQDKPAKAAGKAAAESYDEGAAPASDAHLNKIARVPDGPLLLAAEAGHLFRSDDDGRTWRSLPSPYEGSFFGVLPLPGGALLAFGLRGHLFRSDDAGQSWRAIGTGTIQMLTDAVAVDQQRIAISGLGGTLLLSDDGGRSFELHQQDDRKGISAILALASGSLLAAGEAGVKVISP